MKITIDRNQLYEDLWSTPLKNVQKKYRLTYLRLRGVCKTLNIPTPPSGYWSKVRNSKKAKQTALPDFPKKSIEVYVSDDEPDKIDLNDKLPKKVKPIIVKKTLHNLHPLVKKTYEVMRNSRPNQFDRLKAYHDGYIDIAVSPDNLKRSIRIMDALVKELVRQEFTIKTESGNKSSRSYVSIGKEDIYFQLRDEVNKKERESNERSYYKYEYIPTGKLKLGLSKHNFGMADKTIQDLKSKNLEARLDEFLPNLFTMAEEMKRSRLESEEKHRHWERKRKLLAEAERQRNNDLKQLKLLEEHAESFTKSQYIYDLINRVEAQIKTATLNEKQKLQVKAWLHWATNHANHLNPVQQTINSIFQEDDHKPINYLL